MVACNIAAMGEALVLATKAGLDPEVVFNAVKGGLAGSTVLNAKAPMVISRNFKPGFRIKLHRKICATPCWPAESMKVPLPFTSLVQQMLMSLMNDGKGDLDHSAIVNFVEDMAGVEAGKKAGFRLRVPTSRRRSRSVSLFVKARSVLITGGTGYMGRRLVACAAGARSPGESGCPPTRFGGTASRRVRGAAGECPR